MKIIEIYDTWGDLIKVRGTTQPHLIMGEVCVISFYESDSEKSDYFPMFLNEEKLREFIAALQQFLPKESV